VLARRESPLGSWERKVLLPWLSFLDARVKEPSESVERSPETVEGSKDATLCWDPRELTELLMPR